MNKSKKLIPFVPVLVLPLWLITSRLLNNTQSELAESYLKLASDSGMNSGQAGWLSTNFILFSQATFSNSAYFTMSTFIILLVFFIFVTKSLVDKISNLEKELSEIKEKLNA